MVFETNSYQETEALGERLGKGLQPGAVIAYKGDLGAGKTAFTRGIARGLNCREQVTSPTYTIVNEYLSGRLPLFHFDMYRLKSADDLWDIGWEDYLERGGVCCVEWSENVAQALENPITVCIEKTGDESRRITIEGESYEDQSQRGRFRHRQGQNVSKKEKALKAKYLLARADKDTFGIRAHAVGF